MKDLYKILFLSLGLFLVTGCTDDFEEINTDPDAYSSVPYTNHFAYCIETAVNQWMGASEVAEWVGYISKVEYLNDYSGFIPSNNTFGNRWSNAYTIHEQLQDILDKTEENAAGLKNLRNACVVWQNWCMYEVVNSFGRCPYSQAWKGAPDRGGILQSPYDEEKGIWADILANLKTVADSWAAGLGSDNIGDGDLLYGGNTAANAKWQKFCNSLRLRLALRLVNVEPSTAQSVCEEIFNNQSSYPIITSTADQAYFWWDGSSYIEPWASSYKSRPDHDNAIADVFVDNLLATGDPRIATCVNQAKQDGAYRGMQNGAAQAPSVVARYSRAGSMYDQDLTGFSPVYKASETYYMMAEAALRGWRTPLTAEEAYTKAIELSMEENGLTADDAAEYLANGGKFNGTLAQLYYEEWVGLFKSCIEAWSLYRRTGYPEDIHTAKAYTVDDNDNRTYNDTPRYPGARSYYVGIHVDVPFRFPYPENQFNYNEGNVKAASANIKDYVWGEKMYWDTRSAAEYY